MTEIPSKPKITKITQNLKITKIPLKPKKWQKCPHNLKKMTKIPLESKNLTKITPKPKKLLKFPRNL